jgi:hypothetical protein
MNKYQLDILINNEREAIENVQRMQNTAISSLIVTTNSARDRYLAEAKMLNDNITLRLKYISDLCAQRDALVAEVSEE